MKGGEEEGNGEQRWAVKAEKQKLRTVGRGHLLASRILYFSTW